jgi:hypothetical protein
MRSSCRVVALAIPCVLGVASASHAQGSGWTPEGARVPGWVFTPSVGMGGGWDDNVLLVHPADRPPPDYASPISPALSLDYTGRRSQLSTGYRGSWVFYRTLGDLNSFDQTLRVSGQHRFTSRLTLFGQEHLTAAPSTDAVLLAGVPFYRIGTRTNAATGGLDAALAAGTRLRTTYTLRSVAFDRDDPIGQLLQGGHAHELTVSLRRDVSARLSLGGEYAFNRAIVAAGLAPDSPGEDRFNIQRSSVIVQYRLSPTVGLSGSFGIARLGGSLTHPAQTGPTWGFGASRRGRYATVSAGYERSYVPSFGFGGTFQNEELTGGVLVPFARRRAYVDGRFSWFQNDPLAAGQPKLRTLSASSILGYRATRWLSAEAYYVRTQQDSQIAGGQLARNQLGFRMVAARPMRLR